MRQNLTPGNQPLSWRTALLVAVAAFTMTACGGSGEATSTAAEPATAEPEASYAAGWGPPIGSVLPVLDAPDQAGQTQTLASLSGDQGMLLFLNRSADW